MTQAKLSQPELEQFRSQLGTLIGRLTGEVSQLRDGPASSADGSGQVAPATDLDHQGDAAAHDAEAALTRTLLGTEEQVLAEARAALARLDLGTFGRCERCSQSISRARLKALSYARHCIECARATEARTRR